MAKNNIFNLTKNEAINETDLSAHNFNKNDIILIITEDIMKSNTEETDVEYTDIQLLKNGELDFLGRFIFEEKIYINYYLKNDRLLITAEKGGKINDILLYYDINDKINIVVPKINAIGYYLMDMDKINIKNINELIITTDPERRRRQK